MRVLIVRSGADSRNLICFDFDSLFWRISNAKFLVTLKLEREEEAHHEFDV